MSRLTLVIPALLWPRPLLRDTAFDLRLPALERLLGRARLRRLPDHSLIRWWQQRFDLDQPPAAAPLRLLDLGHDPEQHEWICADPAHVGFDAQGLALSDPALLNLGWDESTALHEAVAPVFAALGDLQAHAADAWHLRLRVPAPVLPDELGSLLGRSGTALLPAGEAGRPWRHALNEAQTILHAHPVNRAREAAGKPPVNTLVLWGGGLQPASGNTDFERLCSDDPVIRGLGRCAGLRVAATPARYEPGTADTLVHWSALLGPTRQRDALAWREALRTLERDWLAPASAALQQGDLRQLEVAAFGDVDALEFGLSRGRLWHFWRRPRMLAHWTA